jgi:hypothetical protein
MDLFDTSDRSRALENEYIRRTEAERLAWSREVERVSLERAALAAALAEDDTDVVNRLYTHGLRASNAAVVEWLPAVEIAWLDGVSASERQVLRTQFAADEQATDAGAALLDEWLTQRPPETLLVAARRALSSRLRALDAGARHATLSRVVSRCEAVGRSAGGAFGIGALSSAERRRIDAIRCALEPGP